ncbi:IscS subfamily cysteine desulfurase [Bacillus timonensis]|nr:IscS subfamily cysteine desulfurase [Bacillus timonensis]
MMIYLDYAATTPMLDEAVNVYSNVAKEMFGNPSSLHDLGTHSKSLLELCRKELAALLNGKENGIYFTSGGTESNFLALQALIDAHSYKGKHIITTRTEHSSIYNFLLKLEKEGYKITYLPVNKSGEISLVDLEQALTSETILTTIQHANSETGVIQPVLEISKLLKQHQVLFHSDCVQTFGKLPIDLHKIPFDSLSISSHKIYGPKGVGAVYINPSVKWNPFVPNTTHEKGLRPGTVNVPGIAAFITAAQMIVKDLEAERARFNELRGVFIDCLKSVIDKVDIIQASSDKQLQHIVGLRIKGIEGQYSMLEFNRKGIAISTGSACQVGQQTPSRTMLAAGKTEEEARQFIRISFGKQTSKEDIEKAAIVCKNICNNL